MSRAFDPGDYEGGCRCSTCASEFFEGEQITSRFVGRSPGGNKMVRPICEACRLAGRYPTLSVVWLLSRLNVAPWTRLL